MDFEFKKKFGQNFLKDKNLLETIVQKAEVSKNDIVVEIGTGKGALTEVLMEHAKEVYSFEIDRDLTAELIEKFDGTNVHMIFKDIMKVSDEELNSLTKGKFKLVANLPYYVTSPIITRFLQNASLESLTVMVQEEVADRIVASPKTKDYGVLTVICQSFGEAKKVLKVGRQMFYPVPKVDSAVVKITRKETDISFDFAAFFEFVKTAFSMRRKKLSTNLDGKPLPKAEVEKLLEKLGFGSGIRAEELSINDLKLLFCAIFDK